MTSRNLMNQNGLEFRQEKKVRLISGVVHSCSICSFYLISEISAACGGPPKSRLQWICRRRFENLVVSWVVEKKGARCFWPTGQTMAVFCVAIPKKDSQIALDLRAKVIKCPRQRGLRLTNNRKRAKKGLVQIGEITWTTSFTTLIWNHLDGHAPQQKQCPT